MISQAGNTDPLAALRQQAIERIGQIDRAYAEGTVVEADWYSQINAVLTSAYLAFDDPIWQSGYRGDARSWRRAREIVVNAIDRDGTFLDIGCANGLLMESVVTWAGERAIAVEPFGVDISAELVERARARLPHWADRIFFGNVVDWIPPHRFDFVRTGLEYVPTHRQGDLLLQLLRDVVAPGGRLIVGPMRKASLEHDRLDAVLAEVNVSTHGEAERTDGEIMRSIVWLSP